MCSALCDPINCSIPSFSVFHYLLEFAQTHVHWVCDAIWLFHPLLYTSLAFSLSQHQGLLQWVCSSHQVAKVLELRVGLDSGPKAEIERGCGIDTRSLEHLSLVVHGPSLSPFHICFSYLPINRHFPPCRDALFPPVIPSHLGFYRKICLDSSLNIFSTSS